MFVAGGWVKTKGDGLWSNETDREVFLNLEVFEILKDEDDYWGSIHGLFSRSQWDVYKHGLMYTDSGVEMGVRKILKEAGLKHWEKIWWSEQGRQDQLAADFDIGRELCKELIENGFYSEEAVFDVNK